jgi:DoxX-like family
MTTYFTTRRLYRMATGLFLALFVGSVILSLADINESYKEFVHLEFPAWSFIALTVAKVLGLVAIVTNRSQTLKDFAFAGFLYDLLLALGGHIAHQELKALLAVFGLLVWVFAFVMDRRFFAARTARS